ncbi:MerR family transcriptional regulator [Promicromonospora sukumoe]|uniref:MerR family transcriptional regulator n=1 Tax=Promicromonospora sukumoe TaxID=88382 RepID=UPI003657880C
MRIGQIARIAGVTVRTLRHYHQIGVLPEPARAANGYREYDTADLLRLIRVRRAAAAGVPLDRVADVLDRSGHTETAALLAQLEEELDAQIDALFAQRVLVRRMALGELDPSFPPDLRLTHEQSSRWDIDPGVSRFDANHAELSMQLIGTPLAAYLNEAAVFLDGTVATPTIQGVSVRFARAGSSTSPGDLRRLVEESVQLLRPVIAHLGSALALPLMSAEARHLIEEHRRGELNATQRDVLDQIATALQAPPPAGE